MIQLSIDTHNKYKNKPSSGYASINTHIADGWKELTPNEFADLVGQGCSFSTSQFNGQRKASKWLGQQAFAIDIDDLDSPKPAEAIALINKMFGVEPTLVYYSFSANSDNNKYRLVIAADSVITDPQIALSVLRGLTNELKADKACVDLARLFYGTTPDKIISYSDSLVETEALVKYGAKHQTQTRKTIDYEYTNKQSPKDLTTLEAVRVKNLIQDQKFFLANDKQSRFERLKLLGVSLGKLGCVGWDLAEQITKHLISSDEKLTQIYITDYDKDYLEIVHNLYTWQRNEAN